MSTKADRLRRVFESLTDIFDRVALLMDVQKTVGMIFQPFHSPVRELSGGVRSMDRGGGVLGTPDTTGPLSVVFSGPYRKFSGGSTPDLARRQIGGPPTPTPRGSLHFTDVIPAYNYDDLVPSGYFLLVGSK